MTKLISMYGWEIAMGLFAICALTDLAKGHYLWALVFFSLTLSCYSLWQQEARRG